MSSSSPMTPLVLFSCLLLSSIATAFNINNILGKDPELSQFSQMLNETGLADEVNKRATITVLAVNNGAMSSISGKSRDLIKRILMTHVVLDYYDIPKLQKMKDKTDILTTLYQSSGVAINRQGFLNVTNTQNGIMFGSAVKDAPLESKLVKLVASQPFNISVLEISSPILAPGIDGKDSSSPQMAPGPAPALPPLSPTKSKAPKKAPAPKKGKSGGSSEESEAPEADSPTKSDDTPPAAAPDKSDSDSAAPKSDSDSATPSGDAPAPASSASRAVLSVGGVMGFVSALLVAF
ncbi:fasciclin-like arabinogalactan protein 3 [Cornus florida]|uniref:fasciclin-like arabinogalactan protein 3 n=1 Tax=Cornus florida TaxID=4283 RepID=UPI0028A28BD9|nr:fasciclin-like arabinogalactan protein 3 [Cornus florida]